MKSTTFGIKTLNRFRKYDIKACPFCCNGAKNYFVIRSRFLSKDREYFVECNACGAKGPLADSEYQAVIKWNVRKLYVLLEYEKSI